MAAPGAKSAIPACILHDAKPDSNGHTHIPCIGEIKNEYRSIYRNNYRGAECAIYGLKSAVVVAGRAGRWWFLAVASLFDRPTSDADSQLSSKSAPRFCGFDGSRGRAAVVPPPPGKPSNMKCCSSAGLSIGEAGV